MAEQTINSRIQLKTDTSTNWGKATTFVPKKGEFIFYSDVKKFKVGDGSKKVGDLDFVNEGQIFRCTQNVTTFAQVTQAINEGKLPVLWDANNDWHTTGLFTRIRNDVYAFFSPMTGQIWDKSNGLSWKQNYLYAAGYESTNGWVNTATYDGLDTRHVSTSVTSTSKDTEVPSAKAVYTAIKNIPTASTRSDGLMSLYDKIKLLGIEENANKYVLPTANSTTLGGVKSGSSVTSTSGLTACPIIGGVPYYKEGTGSGGSSGGTTSVKELTKIQFDLIWTGDQDTGYNIRYTGTLDSTNWTAYDCIRIDLEGPAVSQNNNITQYVYLYRQSYYYDADGSGILEHCYLGYNERDSLNYKLYFREDGQTWQLTSFSRNSGSSSGNSGDSIEAHEMYTQQGMSWETDFDTSKQYLFVVYDGTTANANVPIGWGLFQDGWF